MKTEIKVSFDFDCTLDKIGVQAYAKELLDNGIDVWICTSRTCPENSENGWNDDLFLIADELGIKRDNIIFTNHEDKSNHLLHKNFKWHLDDDWIELNQLNKSKDIVGISVFGNSTWKSKCNRVLTGK